MTTILDTIAAHARKRVAACKNEIPSEAMIERARAATRTREPHCFRAALAAEGLSVIAEVKKASPSKGVISDDFPYLEIAADYVAGGADAMSCLTEPKWFLGSDDIFCAVRAEADMPMIRKDFVVDAYQLYEAKALGADAALLICAILDDAQLAAYLAICDELGMDALVEAHDAGEVARAVWAGAAIIGVNNRNLADFTVDVNNAARLRAAVPDGCLFVAESGIASIEDARSARAAGADAMLVGEFLMRANTREQRRALVREMKEIR